MCSAACGCEAHYPASRFMLQYHCPPVPLGPFVWHAGSGSCVFSHCLPQPGTSSSAPLRTLLTPPPFSFTAPTGRCSAVKIPLHFLPKVFPHFPPHLTPSLHEGPLYCAVSPTVPWHLWWVRGFCILPISSNSPVALSWRFCHSGGI